MQSEIALDVVKGDIRLKGIDTLVCFVYNEQIPHQLLDPFQFVVVAAEADRTFQILQ
ncbi:hypothetical protein D3C73_1332750 [compost metagenome]